MLVQDLVSFALRTAGVLGVGQVALPQDSADATSALRMMLEQWRQKRWLVYRLNWVFEPLLTGKAAYSVGPSGADITTPGGQRPPSIQSCYLRQEVGSGPNSYPIDFPMQVIGSRQEYDRISLKNLQSWPSSIYYDPIVPTAQMYIWPIPVQHNFSLYIAWQEDIGALLANPAADILSLVPSETEEAILYNLALRLITNYKLPPDPGVAAMARASLNTLRTTNFALQPLQIPQSLRPGTRLKNPMGGFYPETSAGVPFTVV